MEKLGLIWSVPFFGTLCAIAICPMIVKDAWEKHSLKILTICPTVLVAALTAKFGANVALHEVMSAIFVHYLPLMALLLSLFTVTGGINVRVNRSATPALNTAVLGVGSLLAGWIGTTGASMLLIRPILTINAGRKSLAHLVVFFIFLVSNIGGAMTPLGDPPLFMGFLEGVDFFWTVKNLWLYVLSSTLVVLAIFFVVDRVMIGRDGVMTGAHIDTKSGAKSIEITGKGNVFLLAMIVLVSMLSGVMDFGHIRILTVEAEIDDLIKDILLFAIAFISVRITPKEVHEANGFSFAAFKEVAEIFIAIFLTIIPIESMLDAGSHGAFAPIFNWVNGGVDSGLNPFRMFWACGMMSAVLDNAPSYLMFFHLAGGDAQALMAGKMALMSISLGAVYMGALTYIGNAPNLMVRAIAAGNGVAVPSFFGYMGWSFCILIPLFSFLAIILF